MKNLLYYCPEHTFLYDAIQYIALIAFVCIALYYPIKAICDKKRSYPVSYWMFYIMLMSVGIFVTLIDWRWLMDMLNFIGIDFSWAPYNAFCYESNLTFSGIACWIAVLILGLISFIYYLKMTVDKKSWHNNPYAKYAAISVISIAIAIWAIIAWSIERAA